MIASAHRGMLGVVVFSALLAACDGGAKSARIRESEAAAGASPDTSADGLPADKAPHRSRMIARDSAPLHVLDFGGSGENILLLPGLGSTAHSFDDFAIPLAKNYHVYAIDLPAHGASGVDPVPLTVQRAADAVVMAMDSLGVRRAHLVGHSISGAVITRVAAQHPDRVHKLVYLDATFDWGGADEAEMDRIAVPRPQPEQGFKTPAEGEAWARKYFYGTWTPALTADGVAQSRVNPGELQERGRQHSVLLLDATIAPKEYRSIKAPALALWGEKTRDSYYFWIDRTDSAMLARADAYLVARKKWEKRGVDRFKREAKAGRVVSFPAHHAMFITAPDRALAEITRFLTDG